MMAKDDLKSAIIVSSITFGIGHILNLINGSGMELVANLCQVVYAMAFEFLFVNLFIKTKNLYSSIICHSVTNALSIFCPPLSSFQTICVSVILTVGALSCAFYLLKGDVSHD